MIPALNVDKLRLDMGDYVLSVQALRKRLGGRYALDRVDLDVKRGAFTALIGPAGAGKSLTLACIAGACKPTRGRVRYFGYEIRGSTQERIARVGIVRTQQTPQPFGNMTLLDTVLARTPAKCSNSPVWESAPDRGSPNSTGSIAAAWNSAGRWPPSRKCCCSTISRPAWSRRRSPRSVRSWRPSVPAA
jgi:ABC-type branched-subunit amino acid transport system ATPase component